MRSVETASRNGVSTASATATASVVRPASADIAASTLCHNNSRPTECSERVDHFTTRLPHCLVGGREHLVELLLQRQIGQPARCRVVNEQGQKPTVGGPGRSGRPWRPATPLTAAESPGGAAELFSDALSRLSIMTGRPIRARPRLRPEGPGNVSRKLAMTLAENFPAGPLCSALLVPVK